MEEKIYKFKLTKGFILSNAFAFSIRLYCRIFSTVLKAVTLLEVCDANE